MQRLISVLIFVVLMSSSLVFPPAPVTAAQPIQIYGDNLADGWQNWSWASVNLAATAPARSSQSMAVDYNGFSGLYLARSAGAITTSGYDAVRFYIHGGSAGGQRLKLIAQTSVGDNISDNASVEVTATANTWRELKIPLADLGAADSTLFALVWQGVTTGSQPTLYIDDVALIGASNANAPSLSNAQLAPAAVPANASREAVLRVQVSDPQGAADLRSVTLDASSLGRGVLPLRDDGRSNDGNANDGLFGVRFTVANGIAPGEYPLRVTARDAAGNEGRLGLGNVVVLSASGGAIPAKLPQRLGYGTNQWDFKIANDWQVNSQVKWDYVYQYITAGWEAWGFSGEPQGDSSFVRGWVRQAWNNGYVPVVSSYLILGIGGDCGEGGSCYVQKLNNAGTIKAYLDSLARAAADAKGDKPVIFQLDPDFYGFVQQISNNPAQRPAGWRVDDPNSIPVQLNVAGYPNTFAGFGRRIVDVIRQNAPNALIGMHASSWATNENWQGGSDDDAVRMAQRVANFIKAAGGDRTDVVFVEWSDRDAGSGIREWWDDTNRSAPNVNRAVLFQNTLSNTLGKRLILWQVPSGNMSLDNTPKRYRDNRAAYIFNHAQDLADAGVLAVLFGGGTGDMTQPSTDGGQIRDQAALAYAKPTSPSAPTRLDASGIVATVRWAEVSVADLAGYRLTYRQVNGSYETTMDVRRANSATVILPKAGEWRLTVRTYDVFGTLSDPSSALTIVTTQNAKLLYAPMARR